MNPELLLVLFILASIVLFFVLVKVIANYRARYLIDFMKEVGTEADVDPYFWDYKNTVICFGSAFLPGKIEVDEVGVFLHALDQFNIRIEWGKIIAIRFVELEKMKAANLRIATPNGIERRLIVEWMPEFNEKIPETVSVVWN
jgi:hypothetical protein